MRGDLIDYFINQHLVKAAAESNTNSRVEVVIPPHKLEEDE